MPGACAAQTESTPMKMRLGMMHKGRVRGAFTLIELLVVVSIIALLIGILLPTLGTARKQAEKFACAGFQKQLSSGLLAFTLENQDQIPGVSSTGLAILNFAQGQDAVKWASGGSSRPTQAFDWISPSVGDVLPTQRGSRLLSILNTYRCPSMKVQVNPYAGAAGDAGYLEVVERLKADDTLQPTSYLMSAYFQYSGTTIAPSSGLGNFTYKSIGLPSPLPNTAVLPKSYFPSLSRIGEPARKASFSDGLRYFDSRTSIADIDVGVKQNFFGSFTHGATYVSDVTYGANYDSPLRRHLKLSYRHGKLELNAAFFDGHIETLSEPDSRNPTYWFPTRTRLGTNASNNDPRTLKFVPAGQLVD